MPWKFFTSTGKEKFTEEERNPSGMIIQFVSTTVPLGWLLCDGREMSIAAYPDLYTAIGTNYGSLTNGSGSSGTSHFRLPDLRGRIPVGAQAGGGDGLYDQQGFALTGVTRSGKGIAGGTRNSGQSSSGSNTIPARTVGNWRGLVNISLTSSESGRPAHNHSLTESGTHYHTVTSNGTHNHGYGYTVSNYVSQGSGVALSGASTFGPYYYDTSTDSANLSIPNGTTGGSLGSTVYAPTGGTHTNNGYGHNNVQESLVVTFIIKT